MIDLHVHSTASDGSFSPEALVAKALEEGLTILALTDHDTIAGLAAARQAALGSQLRLIGGIELDIEWKSGECHLLGYGIDEPSPRMIEMLERVNQGRRTRNETITMRFHEAGINLDLDRVEAIADGGTVGRPHFARALVEMGAVKNIQQAFDRYLARDRPFFVDRKSLSLEEGVSIISESGGIPVLAHPLSLYVSWGKLSGILADFKAQGVRGIEAWHPGVRVTDARRLEALAREHSLLVTAGSDFHGAARPERRLGHTTGKLVIEERFWSEELGPALS
ncbi:MAG TPA: PHP domain-containing protein [Treponemataceae bacterium]|nr:PHP domain-containing protein [Treponemataceae bacterium]